MKVVTRLREYAKRYRKWPCMCVYGCVRLDDVETAITYRNNGYSRESISYLIDYHKENSDVVFYLRTENSTAQKIYTEAGFTLMPIQYEAWSAVYSANEYNP